MFEFPLVTVKRGNVDKKRKLQFPSIDRQKVGLGGGIFSCDESSKMEKVT